MAVRHQRQPISKSQAAYLRLSLGTLTSQQTLIIITTIPSSTLAAHPIDIGPRPWETWNLDKQFLRALSRHNTNRPDQALNQVVANICDNLGVRDSLLAFIPEDPFPARGFVKAVGSLVELAVVRSIVYSAFGPCLILDLIIQTIPRTRDSVCGFAKQVASWIDQLTQAFGSSDDIYSFTWTTWQNLRKMRSAHIDQVRRLRVLTSI
jgi:hypothetical protein